MESEQPSESAYFLESLEHGSHVYVSLFSVAVYVCLYSCNFYLYCMVSNFWLDLAVCQVGGGGGRGSNLILFSSNILVMS
jgi:hypothetical protein